VVLVINVVKAVVIKDVGHQRSTLLTLPLHGHVDWVEGACAVAKAGSAIRALLNHLCLVTGIVARWAGATVCDALAGELLGCTCLEALVVLVINVVKAVVIKDVGRRHQFCIRVLDVQAHVVCLGLVGRHKVGGKRS